MQTKNTENINLWHKQNNSLVEECLFHFHFTDSLNVTTSMHFIFALTHLASILTEIITRWHGRIKPSGGPMPKSVGPYFQGRRWPWK